MWTGRVLVHPIKNIFGAFNLYHSGSPIGNNGCVEKLFADLECASGRVVKKIEMALDLAKVDTNTTAFVHLADVEVHTIYKFMALSGFRNGPIGLHMDGGAKNLHGRSQDTENREWVDQLEYLLKRSHQELVERDELLEPVSVRHLLARYKQIADMKLLFWTVPEKEELLLGNLLVGLEGYQYSHMDGRSYKMALPAHLFLPVSPRIVMVLCSEDLCKRSMLCNARHEATTPYDRPPKGKLIKSTGRKKYQDILPNWKTTYQVTSMRIEDLHTINCFILGASIIVVYKSRSTLDSALGNIVSFREKHDAWRARSQQPCTETPSQTESASARVREKIASQILELLQSVFRPIIEQASEELQQDLITHVETFEKVLCYTICHDAEIIDQGPAALCCVMADSYFLGERKISKPKTDIPLSRDMQQKPNPVGKAKG
jgi:hypothetical protein